MIRRPWEPDLTFCCHSLVTNEQTSKSRRVYGWLRVLRLGTCLRVPLCETRTECATRKYYCPNELRALFMKCYCTNWRSWFSRQFAQIIEFFKWIKISINFYFHLSTCQFICEQLLWKPRMGTPPGLHFTSPVLWCLIFNESLQGGFNVYIPCWFAFSI